jgi:hypothetical protein
MNFELIGELIRLRYQLLWARTRSRNGRIALFIVGYLIFALVMLLLGAGGLGAAIAAVRSGKAQPVTQIVLGSLFVELVLPRPTTGGNCLVTRTVDRNEARTESSDVRHRRDFDGNEVERK